MPVRCLGDLPSSTFVKMSVLNGRLDFMWGLQCYDGKCNLTMNDIKTAIVGTAKIWNQAGGGQGIGFRAYLDSYSPNHLLQSFIDYTPECSLTTKEQETFCFLLGFPYSFSSTFLNL